MPVQVAISMGDYNGIGPEIILKTLQRIDFKEITPVIFGHVSVLNYYAKILGLGHWSPHLASSPQQIKKGSINFVNCIEESFTVDPGVFSEHAGASAMQAVEKGIEWCMKNNTQALVTAPISKEAINKAGYRVPGHTEFLADKTGTDDYLMMLVHDQFRVGLTTIHIPVSEITDQISTERITKQIKAMHKALHDDFNIDTPRIAVLGLNPHAGDGGIIGTEEIDLITPAILKAEGEQIHVRGPFPADGFFGNRQYKQFDGVLAMYHDQGLVPFKTLSFGGGVNVTTGLPIVRTSPDHGTAFDIAGQNKANPSSFLEALSLAVTLSKNRRQKKL